MSSTSIRTPGFRLDLGYPDIILHQDGFEAPVGTAAVESPDFGASLRSLAGLVAAGGGRLTVVLPRREVWYGRLDGGGRRRTGRARAAAAEAAAALACEPADVALVFGRAAPDGAPVAGVRRSSLTEARALLAAAGFRPAAIVGEGPHPGFTAAPCLLGARKPLPLPSVSLPSVKLPSVSLPPVKLPPVALPSLTLPALRLPAFGRAGAALFELRPFALGLRAPGSRAVALGGAAAVSLVALVVALGEATVPVPEAPTVSPLAFADLEPFGPPAPPAAPLDAAALPAVAEPPAVLTAAPPPARPQRLAAAPVVPAPAPVVPAPAAERRSAPAPSLATRNVDLVLVDPGNGKPPELRVAELTPPGRLSDALQPPRPRPGGAPKPALATTLAPSLDLRPVRRPTPARAPAGAAAAAEVPMAATPAASAAAGSRPMPRPDAVGALVVAALGAAPVAAVASVPTAAIETPPARPEAPRRAAAPAKPAAKPIPVAAAVAKVAATPRRTQTPAPAPVMVQAPAPSPKTLVASVQPQAQPVRTLGAVQRLPASGANTASQQQVRQAQPARQVPVLGAVARLGTQQPAKVVAVPAPKPVPVAAPKPVAAPTRVVQAPKAVPPVRVAAAPTRVSPAKVMPAKPAPAKVAAAPQPTRVAAKAEPTRRTGVSRGNLSLIGVFGGEEGRHALVRLPNGSVQRVRAGDRVQGVQVASIGSDTVRLSGRGRDTLLELPD